MNKQITLSAFNDELAKVRTKKKEFLAQMDRIIPWGEWKALIQPYYYKGERGNKPYELELMLRIFILQNLYNLSDEGTVAEVIHCHMKKFFRRFAICSLETLATVCCLFCGRRKMHMRLYIQI